MKVNLGYIYIYQNPWYIPYIPGILMEGDVMESGGFYRATLPESCMRFEADLVQTPVELRVTSSACVSTQGEALIASPGDKTANSAFDALLV